MDEFSLGLDHDPADDILNEDDVRWHHELSDEQIARLAVEVHPGPCWTREEAERWLCKL